MAQLTKAVGALLCVVCLLVPLTSATTRDVSYCNKKANYAVKVSGIDISPFPISRGVETTFAIAAATDEVISGGNLKIDVTYWGFHIHSETHDLCKKTVCPVANGNFTIIHKQALPGITPPGSYTLKMTLSGANKKELTCINFDFSMGFIAAADGLAEA
ncbi:hypothetical protein F511_42726 [Dorcoceras hygrometricum]|uniref:MD-2-related lipid-recognition domain-containing protein n=1 Tax=Dorcoceras hygrometricum TaxID=472368 RepID=A0A2Z7CGA5_9LAMI|nr:hypothetical protein F511_42726 [Dorcoceras hygrometricum]